MQRDSAKAKTGSQPSTSSSRSNMNAQDPPPVLDNYINILLLGETGVGKSTFINAFVNYISFKEFDIALKNEPLCIIPTKFHFYTKDMEENNVSMGTDKNEFTEVGVSATQGPKSYVFPLGDGKHNLRIIDTPGIGDTRGIEQDKKNFVNLMDFLGAFENLHSICILMRPNESRLTVMFEFCLKQLLSRLDKSAANNIMFVFTNTRSTFYRPGETKTILKKTLEDIERTPPHIKIPFNEENIFCLDNEAYRFLIACKNSIEFDEEEKNDFTASWDKSVKECIRLLIYILGNQTRKALPPHKVQNTVSVNKARRIILILSKPLADISQLIQDNRQVLINYQSKVKSNKQNMKALNKRLYLPCINLRQIKLTKPVTVCTSEKCAKIVTVENNKMRDYCQRCHDPCYLTNVPKEIIGTPELINCYAMSGTNCKFCTCEFTLHMHVYYMTESYEDKIEDKSIKLQVDQGLTNAVRYANYMKCIEDRISALNGTHDTITKILAKFAHFLKINTILPFNDSYKAYIEYQIDREEHLGVNQDKNLIEHYRDMLNMYEEEKVLLEQAMNMAEPSHLGQITSQDIMNSVQALFSLEEFGSKLKSLYEMQQEGILREHEHNEEYYHSNPNDSSFLAFTPQEKATKLVRIGHFFKSVFHHTIGRQGENANEAIAIPGDLVYDEKSSKTNLIYKNIQKENLNSKTSNIKMQIKSPLDNFVGTLKHIKSTAVGMLHTSLDTSANRLGHLRDWNENRGNENRENMHTPKNKLTETIKIPHHLLEFARDILPKARSIVGIEKIEFRANTLLLIEAVDREAIQRVKLLLEYKVETIKLSRNFIVNLGDNDGKMLRQILDTSKPAYIKVNGDSNNAFRSKCTELSISVAGTTTQISKTKLLIEQLQTFGVSENNRAGLIFISSCIFYAVRKQTGFVDVIEYKCVREDDRGAYGIDTSMFQGARNSFGDASSDFEDANSNFGDATNFGSDRNTFGETWSLSKVDRCNFEDARSNRGDTRCVFGDTKNQFADTGSVFGDTGSIFGNTGNVFKDTECAFGIDKTTIKVNRGPFYGCNSNDNKDFGSTKGAFNLLREEFHVPKHLMGAAQGSIGQNLDKARNIPGIKIILPKEEGFVVEATSPTAIKEARSILEISEELVILSEETVEQFKASGPNVLFDMKVKTGIFSVTVAPPRQHTMAEELISQQISNLLRDYPEEQNHLKKNSLQSAVLYLPRHFIVRLLEQDQIMLTSLINISGVQEIKIFKDKNLREEATKIPYLEAIILGSHDNVEKAKFLLDRAKIIFQQLPVPNIEYDEKMAMSILVKTRTFYPNRPAKGLVNIQLVGNPGSISKAKIYFKELSKEEFKIPENLVSLATEESDCNLEKAESLAEIEGNIAEVCDDAKEGVDKVRASLEVEEVDVDIPQDIPKTLTDKESTLEQIVESKECVLRNVAAEEEELVVEGMCNIQLVSNLGSISRAKIHIKELSKEEFKIPENLVSLATEESDSNFKKAESLAKIEIEGDIVEVCDEAKEGVEKSRAILKVEEVDFDIPQDIYPKALADKESNLEQIVEAKSVC